MRKVQIKDYLKLDSSIKQQINKVTFDTFGHIEIVNKYKWAEPSWTAFIEVDLEVVSFVNLIERDILFSWKNSLDKTKSFKTIGINNLITLPKFRQKGYAETLMNEVQKFAFDKLKAEYCLLLCADSMIEFYEKYEWKRVNADLYFLQDDLEIKWESNFMILSKHKVKELPSVVDLCGLPW